MSRGRAARTLAALPTAAAIALLAPLAPLAPPNVASAQGLGLPGPGGCYEDALEPNTYSAPTVLSESMERADLGICSSDDWFRIDLRADQVATVELFFEHDRGDIDMTLQDASYHVLAVSESADDYERITWVAREDTSLLLRVYGYDGAANDYRLRYERDDYSASCARSDAATETREGALEAGVVCRGRAREFVLPARAGEWIELLLLTEDALGDLDVRVFDEGGALLASSSGAGPVERVRVFPERDEPLRLRVEGAPDGIGRFELGVARLHAVPDLVVEGEVHYSRALSSSRGLKGEERVAPAGCVVELVRHSDGLPVARGLVEADGGFRLRARYTRPEDVWVRVSAALEAPEYRLAVVFDVGGDPYAAYSRLLSEAPVDEAGARRVTIDLPVEDAVAGALNVAAVSRAGLEMVRSYLREPADVTIVWARGRPYGCGSCFSDGRIYLGGGEADPDEQDSAVILHELGHLLMAHIGWDDSPGGLHDGSQTLPLVAYGEGIATVLAAIAGGTPLYVDAGAGSLLAFQDIERLTSLQGYGTSDRTLQGFVSEWLTAGLTWDILDDEAEGEPFDTLAIGEEAVLRALFEHAVDRRRADLGPAGMELTDWLNTLRCLDPAASSRLLRLARGHQGFPFPELGKDKCEWSAIQ